MEVDATMVIEDGEGAKIQHKQEQEEVHEAEEFAADLAPSPSPLQRIHHALQQQGEPRSSGARPAPNFKATSAICEKDGPGPRCGHTLTAIAAVGEEGTAGYVGPRLILFGGATASEGKSSLTAAAQTNSPGAAIRAFHSSPLKFEGCSIGGVNS